MKQFTYDALITISAILLLPFLIVGAIVILALLMVASPIIIIIELVDYVIQRHRYYDLKTSVIGTKIRIEDDLDIPNE